MERPRVLIAEDEALIRLDLRHLLEDAGFDVCAEAKDGVEAVELARETLPDLVLMDVRMPKLDGVSAVRTIMAERPTPVVMVTAFSQDELVTRAVEAGAYGYVVKPFREQDVVPTIRTALARHQELRKDDRPIHERLQAIGDELTDYMVDAETQLGRP